MALFGVLLGGVLGLTPQRAVADSGTNAVADSGTAAASVPSGDIGQTPGTYAYYTFDQASVDNLSWQQKITSSPGQANVFWSNQFTFDNDWTGYTGFQTHRDGVGMFLVSIWNSTDSRVGSAGTYCTSFSEDGTGRTCRLDRSPVPGHNYRWDVSSDQLGWYTFKITDTTADTSFTLGSIKVGENVGLDTSHFVTWTEYFDWNNPKATCLDEPYSRHTMTTPTSTIDGDSVAATWTKTRVSDSCSSQSAVKITDDRVVQRNGIQNSAAGAITNPGGLCLAGAKAGESLTLQGCDNSMTQQWNRGADGTLRAAWRCLTPLGDATPYDTSLQKCRSVQAQGFRAAADGTILNPTTKTCLKAKANRVGAKVMLVDCKPELSAQQWNVPQGVVR